MVVLPEPIFPITATFSPALTFTFISFKIICVSFEYEKLTWLNSIDPVIFSRGKYSFAVSSLDASIMNLVTE